MLIKNKPRFCISIPITSLIIFILYTVDLYEGLALSSYQKGGNLVEIFSYVSKIFFNNFWKWSHSLGKYDTLVTIIGTVINIFLFIAVLVIPIISGFITGGIIGGFIGFFAVIFTGGNEDYFMHSIVLSVYFVTMLIHICAVWLVSYYIAYIPEKLIFRPIITLIAVVFFSSKQMRRDIKIERINSEEKELSKEKAKILGKLAIVQKNNPDIAEDMGSQLADIFSSSSLDETYRGYFGEQARRFEINQIRKSVQIKQKLVLEAALYIQQLIEINKELTKLTEAKIDYEVTKERVDVKREQLQSGKIKEVAELKIETERLEALQKKLTTEVAISELLNERAELNNSEVSDEEEDDERLVNRAQQKIASRIAIQIAQIEGYVKKAKFMAEQEQKIKEEYPEDADKILDYLDKLMAREDDGNG